MSATADTGRRLPREPSPCFLLLHLLLPDLLEGDGLVDLLVVVRVVLPGGQLKEGLSDELALAVPAPTHCLVHLEDGVAQVHAEVYALCLGLTLVIVYWPWRGDRIKMTIRIKGLGSQVLIISHQWSYDSEAIAWFRLSVKDNRDSCIK